MDVSVGGIEGQECEDANSGMFNGLSSPRPVCLLFLKVSGSGDKYTKKPNTHLVCPSPSADEQMSAQLSARTHKHTHTLPPVTSEPLATFVVN